MTISSSKGSTAQDKVLIFLHIPKAAGTTLHKIIERQFGPEVTFSLSGTDAPTSIKEFIGLSEAKRQHIKVLKGHMPYGLHRYLCRPATYITMLRDPIDRIISHYYFVLSSPGHYLHTEVTSRNMSLTDFVMSGISTELTNDQTRLISGVERINTRLLDGTERRTLRASQEIITAEILGIAKKNLRDHFVAFGLSSRFDESLLLFKRLLGWRNIYYVRHNVTKNRPGKGQVSREVKELIAKKNEMDLELYDFARQKFEGMIKEQSAGFKNELRSFERNNRLYGRALRSYILTRETCKSVKATIRKTLHS